MYRSFEKSIYRVKSAIKVSRTIRNRSVVSVAELTNTLSIFKEKHYLSPLSGAILNKTNFIKRLYEQSELLNAEDRTSTGVLVTSLFYLQESEFRATQNKSNAAYSLSAELLAEIIPCLEDGSLNHDAKKQEICSKWRSKHKELTGSKISKYKILDLINTILASKLESQNGLYPENITALLLMGFLHLQAKSRQEVLNYIHPLAQSNDFIEEGNISLDLINEDYLHDGLGWIETINDEYQLPEDILDFYIEPILLTLIWKKAALDRVAFRSYGYNSSLAKANCTEASFHNLCNYILFNESTGRFDFSQLPSALKPNQQFYDIYKMQNFNTEMINSEIVGQAFMNLLSGNGHFKYISGDYELDATIENFIPIINFLFGTEATEFEDLSRLFSNQNRTITFTHETELDDVVKIVIQNSNEHIPSTDMTLRFVKSKHCDFNSSSLGMLQNGYFLKSKLCDYTLENAGKEFLLFSVLSEFYFNGEMLKYFKGKTLTPDQINAVIYNKLPSDNKDVCRLFLEIYPQIRSHPHLQSYVKYLYKKGFNLLPHVLIDDKLQHEDALPAIQLLISCGGDVTSRDDYGNTTLHTDREPNVINFLISQGINVNATNKEGQTPLYCVNKIESAHTFIAQGAKVDVIDVHGGTLLHLDKGDDFVNLFLQYGLNVNAKDKHGNTPLHCMTDPDSVRTLIKHGANINSVNNNGTTVLARHRHSVEVVKILLDAGINPNSRRIDGTTELFRCKNMEIVRAFLDAGANPNALDSNGCSPLFYVTHVEIAKTLLDGGANPNIVNGQGKTILDVLNKKVADGLLEKSIADQLKDILCSKTHELLTMKHSISF